MHRSVHAPEVTLPWQIACSCRAAPGAAVADFLAGAWLLANVQSRTAAWFALNFGPSTAALLSEAPRIEKVELLAEMPG